MWGETPLVSLLMVVRDSAPYIGAAVASARAQTWPNLEIVVLDDASADGTRAIAEQHARADPRVRVLDGPGAGLAAIRNASLAAARGRHAAILDSDDLLHPEHVARLMAEAQASGAEIVAANMTEFDEAPVRTVRRFARGLAWTRARPVTADEYLRANTLGAEVVLGYLKPLFDLDFLRGHGLGYDPAMRIGEDFDLVFRALLAGARLRYLPAPSYFYRRHAASTSARTPAADLAAMLASNAAYPLPEDNPLVRAREMRRRALAGALRMTEAVGLFKARRPFAAIRALGDDRIAWRQMLAAAREGLGRRAQRRLGKGGRAERERIALLIGATPPDGLLADRLAAFAADGWRVVQVPPGEAMADGLPAPEVVALADEAARALLPFAIAPDALVLGPDGLADG